MKIGKFKILPGVVLFSLISLFDASFRPVSAADKFWIDSFNHSKPGHMPRGWKGRAEKAAQFYKVAEVSAGSSNKYLKVDNRKTDMFIIKRAGVDIVKYPYLNFKWRVRNFPPGGNESIKAKCDSAASVNLILVASRWRPKTIKYSWSTTLKKGTVTESPYAVWPARTDVIVLQSGRAKAGQWVHEKRNVLEDYKRFYNKKNVDSFVVEALLIMSDGDNTRSLSSADYDNIYFSAE